MDDANKRQAIEQVQLLNHLLTVLDDASPAMTQAALQEARSRMQGQEPANVVSMYVDYGDDL